MTGPVRLPSRGPSAPPPAGRPEQHDFKLQSGDLELPESGKTLGGHGTGSPLVVLAHHMSVFGGTGQVMVRTARLLGQRGWRFAALCPVGELHHELSAAGVTVRDWPVARLRVSFGGLLEASRAGVALSRVVGSAVSTASLLHAHSLKACLLAWPACRRAGVPILWHVHDFLPLRRARRILMLLAEHAAEGVVAVSRAVASEFQASQTTVVPNGIEWLPAPAVEGPRDIMLYVGRLDPEKRPGDFVDLAAKCRLNWPHIRFVIAGTASPGSESFEADLRARAHHAGLLDRSYRTFAGFVGNVQPLLDTALALVIPSEREPFGLVALEAMRSGVPVLGTRGGGLDDIVVDGETGYLVQPGDVGTLEQRAGELLHDRTKREYMGCRGRDRYLAHFRAEHYADRMAAVYGRLLRG
jgi:glycosyltransferase involved in cell wall biosynthesis